MAGTWSKRLACAVAITVITLVGAAPQFVAAQSDSFTFNFGAGEACAFALELDVTPSPHQVYREFYDKDGHLVRYLQAGKGNSLTFTNANSGATLSLRPNGAVGHVTVNADGTETWASTGHNVLIMFSTDDPPGPSTTLYVGRVVYTVEPLNNFKFTLLRTSGSATDICAALSP